MLMPLRCDLRQVSDAEDLTSLPKRAQFAPDDLCHGATDAGIHFIEHHAAGLLRAAGNLYGKRQARQLAAGSNLCECARRLAGVRAHSQLDVIEAVLCGLRAPALRHIDLEAATGHP